MTPTDTSERRDGGRNGWRDMASAPTDGTKVLLFVVQGPSEYTEVVGEPEGWSNINIGYFENGSWEHEHSGDPVVWQPLPIVPITRERIRDDG